MAESIIRAGMVTARVMTDRVFVALLRLLNLDTQFKLTHASWNYSLIGDFIK